MRERDVSWVDVRPEVQAQFNERLQAKLDGAVWSTGCESWYLDASGKNRTLWPGFTFKFREAVERLPQRRTTTSRRPHSHATQDTTSTAAPSSSRARRAGSAPRVAERLHSKGANVALVGLEPERLEALAARLGERAFWCEADVTDLAALQRAADETGAALRRHRRGDRQRRRPLHRLGRDGPGGDVRARDRGQPARRLAHRPRGPALPHRAQGLPAQRRLARGLLTRAADGRLRGQQGRRRGR